MAGIAHISKGLFPQDTMCGLPLAGGEANHPSASRLRRSVSDDLRVIPDVSTLGPPAGDTDETHQDGRPNLTSSTSAPISFRSTDSADVVRRPHWEHEDAGGTARFRKHHRRCISVPDGHDQRISSTLRSQPKEGGGGWRKESTKEELEGYVQRLESEIRQLEAKLEAFTHSSQGWVGLEEKRNRKKFVEEMGRTLAANRKRLQSCRKRLRQQQAAAPSKSHSSDDDDASSSDATPAHIKELLDACLKPQETFFGLIRRLRERQLCLDKYYYYQDCDDDHNSNKSTGAASSLASSPAIFFNPGEADPATPLSPPPSGLLASRSLPTLLYPSLPLEQPPQAPCSLIVRPISHTQPSPPPSPPLEPVPPGPQLGRTTDGLEVCYADIRFREGMLGHGCFGTVYPASLPHTGPVAVKILKRGPHQRLSFQREIAALKKVLENPGPDPHAPLSPPIIRLCGYCAEPHACILTELCEGGSLESVIRRGVKMSDREVVRVGMRVAEAMRLLLAFDPPIFHRDLSTANILLRKQGDYASACLADFGIAVEVAAGAETYPEGATSQSKNGNPRYRAPEVTLSGRYTRKSDVYSFGLVLFEMATGTIPFVEVETKRVARHIAEGHRPRFPKGTTTDKRLQRLVKKCCRRNPDRRPDFVAISRTLAKIDVSFV